MSFSGETEILSPVGNREMLVAAVRSGADAVYLGAKEFSARRNAENFTLTELEDAVSYCHTRGVKVYLTLNILIKDSELKAAVSLARDAYNCGIDGIIIQDLGLAAALKELLPALPLHASTQMSVHTPAALDNLKKLGFCRVVAAREMSKTELREFCKEAKRLGLEVEVFVHGALCMSVSGQCLLSAFLGSRSGNRGCCAGPCRLPFKAPDGTGYDLSLKDLSLFEYIGELAEMGVTSFKIEGRMKRPEYVAAATAAGRAAIDTGSVPYRLYSTLANVFSRSGFTDGYYKDKTGPEMFGIRTKDDVKAAETAFPFLHGLYRGERPSVAVCGNLAVKSGEQITLTLSDGENTVTATGEIPEAARNSAADEQSLRESVSKLGGTPYYFNDLKIRCDGGLFVSAKQLNGLRRQATALLDEKRAEPKREKSKAFYTEKTPDRKRSAVPKIYIRCENEEQIPKDLSGIEMLIFPLEKNIAGLPENVSFAVDIPRFADDKYIKARLSYFKEKGVKYALCGNISAMEIAVSEGFSVIADTGINVYNSESAKAVGKMGAEAVILSNEITLSAAAALNSPVLKGIIAYGKIPLMLFKNCPLKNGRSCKDCDRKGKITDRRNTEFAVRCRAGASEMLNSVPVWLADRMDDLKSVDFAVLYFTDETADDVRKIINSYKNGLPPCGSYTRGLFYRGTI